MEIGRQNVVVIGVNYGSDEAAVLFVKSVAEVPSQLNLMIILVDNTERSDSNEFFESIRKQRSQVVCIKSPYNLGYFGGASFGFKEYLKSNDFPDWVIVSNVDITFSKDFWNNLYNIKKYDSLGVVAPSIWSNTLNRDWNPKVKIRPTVRRMHAYKLIFRNYYVLNMYELLYRIKEVLRHIKTTISLNKSSRSYDTASGIDGKVQAIYAPHGACIIFSKLYFLKGGTIDYPSFLYGEEIFVAETALILNLRVVFNPKLEIYSSDHALTGMFHSREIASYIYDSAVFNANTYFPRI